MRQSLLNVTPRSQMMPNFIFPLHKYPKEIKPAASAFTTCADTCEGKRFHATMPRIFKLRAEDLRREVHRFHPGINRDKDGAVFFDFNPHFILILDYLCVKKI